MHNSQDPSQIYLASASSKNMYNGTLSVYSLKDINATKPEFGEAVAPRLTFMDAKSHFSPIKGLAWNPFHKGVLATGGSTMNDSVMRLYDINNLC